MQLTTAGEMQEMDRLTIESFGIPGRVLMENAGRGAVDFLLKTFKDLEGRRVGVMAGRGNNGGDGFVIARYLIGKGVKPTVYLLSEASRVRGDAEANLRLLAPVGVPVVEMPDEDAFLKRRSELRHQDLWIDAVLGTGLKSDVRGYFKTIIAFINDSGKPVFAVDIPSGLDSDSGQPRGVCIRADATATFALAKTGHVVHPGVDYTGRLHVVEIGIPDHIVSRVDPRQFLLTDEMITRELPRRAPDAHKGAAGHLLVAAGAPGKTGAAAMTAMSAMRAGAGLVTLGAPMSLNPVLEPQVLEAMTWPLPEGEGGILDESALPDILDLLPGKRCLALGPGVGTAAGTRRLVHRLIAECPVPLVVDADGLNCLAGRVEMLKDLKAPAVLTPHPGEMARLMDATTGEVQKDRVTCARDFAREFHVHLVLKGARTVIAHPDGTVYINPTGNPGMASGGMGDVLTGLIGGFIVQGLPPDAAARVGVYLHGAAADALAERTGPYGFLASDVMNAVPGEIAKRLLPKP
ncbi:MAG: NAD(P)H-hydrate dehydratase [Desulfobacterales bacterium]|nr:NAD(P)H-hydrate dehydratase [Desulfobacterales bacterium]